MPECLLSNFSESACSYIKNQCFNIGPHMEISTFDFVLVLFMPTSLIFLLWKIQSMMRSFLTVYSKFLILTVTYGVVWLFFAATPLNSLVVEFPYTKMILSGWSPAIDIWLLVFHFQPDISLRSVSIAAAFGLSYKLITLVVQLILYFSLSLEMFMQYVELTLIGINFAVVFLTLIIPWTWLGFSPRSGMRIWAVFLSVMMFFYFMDAILKFVNNIYHDCMGMTADLINYLLYAFVLFIVVRRDADHWIQQDAYLNETFLENLGKIVRSKQKVPPFPKIKWDDIEHGPQIGHGGYSLVSVGVWKGTRVAIKEINVPTEKDKPNILKDIISESTLLASLRHPNIVSFLGLVIDPTHIALVMEYLPGGSLWELLRKIEVFRSSPLSYQKKINILTDVARGVYYLHSIRPPVIHRDLKSANVLMDSHYNCKVADFGLSRVMNDDKIISKIGTVMWASPEVLLGKPYNQKVDVWSFGVIIWELVSYRVPYEGLQNQHLIWKSVTEERKCLDIPEDCPVLFSKMMKKCWSWNPAKRPDIENIIMALEKNNAMYLSKTSDRPVSPEIYVETLEDILIPKSKDFDNEPNVELETEEDNSSLGSKNVARTLVEELSQFDSKEMKPILDM